MSGITKTRLEQEELLAALLELEERKKTDRISFEYQETGPLNRHMYPKHMEVFEATKDHQEIIFMAGNRCGKTFAGSRMIAWHATGLYPEWWIGRRFNRPISIWACGKTGATVRDVVQKELLGERTLMSKANQVYLMVLKRVL